MDNLSYLGNGTDFISDDIVATFDPGETSTSVVVPVVADDVNNEGTEFFALGLRLPNVSMDSGLIVNLGANNVAAASILDSGKYDAVFSHLIYMHNKSLLIYFVKAIAHQYKYTSPEHT